MAQKASHWLLLIRMMPDISQDNVVTHSNEKRSLITTDLLLMMKD